MRFHWYRIRKELETSQKECEELKSKARRDRLTLENQLDMEKVRSEVEKKKSAAQIETLQKEKVAYFCFCRYIYCLNLNLTHRTYICGIVVVVLPRFSAFEVQFGRTFHFVQLQN